MLYIGLLTSKNNRFKFAVFFADTVAAKRTYAYVLSAEYARNALLISLLVRFY